MTDRDPRIEELEDALRRHYRDETDKLRLRPITAAEIRAAGAARPPRRSAWVMAVAASLTLVVSGVAIVWGQQASRLVPAVPAATQTTSRATASPGTGAATTSWTPRVTAPLDAGRYAQVSVDDTVYLFAGIADDQTCALDAYRYSTGPDYWERLDDGPARATAACAGAQAFAAAGRIYVAIQPTPSVSDTDLTALELYAYDLTDESWQTLPSLTDIDAASCTPIGLETGIFCLDAAAGATATPATFHFFSYDERSWRPGEAQLAAGQSRLSVQAHAIRVAGRELVLLDARLPGGGVSVVTYDPATGRLGQGSGHPGTGAELGPVQVTATGIAFFGPPSDPSGQGIAGGDSRATTGLALNVASQEWSTVTAPHPDGPLTVQTPSDGSWALRHYSADSADFVLVNGYLYQPDQRRWLAVAPLANPDEDDPATPLTWVGRAMLCRTSEPLNCWGLSTGQFAAVTTGLDQAAITASNSQVR